MFYLRAAVRNICRSKLKSVLTISVCVCIITLLYLYWGNIENANRQLRKLADNIPIQCRISNLNGNKVVGLDIPDEQVRNLQSTSLIKDSIFTVRLMAGEGDFSLEQWKDNLNIPIIGTNSIRGVEGIEIEQVTMVEGVNLDFLKSSEKKCIVSHGLMKENNWVEGEVVTLNTFYYFHENDYALKIYVLDMIDFQIVGTMDEVTIDDDGYLPPKIIVPLDAIREIFYINDIPFSADSASFYVTDPIHLNEFKDEMKSFGLMSIVPDARDSTKGEALSVRDSVFITSANRLRQIIDTLLLFLPIVVVVVICIGYVISNMVVYSRSKDFFVMRSIGMRYKEVFSVLFVEQLLLAMSGIVIQGIIFTILLSGAIPVLAVTNGCFIVNFMIGNAIAIHLMGKKNVMEALT